MRDENFRIEGDPPEPYLPADPDLQPRYGVPENDPIRVDERRVIGRWLGGICEDHPHSPSMDNRRLRCPACVYSLIESLREGKRPT